MTLNVFWDLDIQVLMDLMNDHFTVCSGNANVILIHVHKTKKENQGKKKTKRKGTVLRWLFFSLLFASLLFASLVFWVVQSIVNSCISRVDSRDVRAVCIELARLS